MAKKTGLGLGALFGEDYGESIRGESLLTIPIMRVEPREDQPRKSFDDEALEELAESIRNYGLIQPITVRRSSGDYYQIIAGERRWRAARAAGLDEVPIRVIEADDKKAMELALVENLQREDLNPIEEARGYRTLMSEYGMTQEEASGAVGKSRPAIANALRLLSLSQQVLDLVENGTLSAGHARALIPIRDEELQRQAAETVIQKQLSVRQTEALVSRLVKEPSEEQKSESISVDYIHEIEKELENSLGRKVKLVDGRKKGRIEIEFYGAEDREKLIENLRLFSSLRNNK